LNRLNNIEKKRKMDMNVSDELEKKWCSNCWKNKPIEGGAFKITKNPLKRWRCFECSSKVKEWKEKIQQQSKRLGAIQ
jgi:hypothetical protein